MALKTIVALLISSLLFVPVARGQEVGRTKLISSKPSVYLSFERYENVVTNGVREQNVVLRFHNNLTFPIAVDANYMVNALKTVPLKLHDGGIGEALPDGAEVVVCYDTDIIPFVNDTKIIPDLSVVKNVPKGSHTIVSNPGPQIEGACYSDAGWSGARGNGDMSWVISGNSFIFKVPARFVGKDSRVSTTFFYEWEFKDGNFGFDEPGHKVYFYGEDAYRTNSRR